MSTNSYKTLLVDLDGTLARAFLQITPRVAEAVRRVAELVPVGIVSSREHRTVAEVATGLGLRGLQIAEGGARIFYPDTLEAPWLRTLRPEDAKQILGYLEGNGLTFSAVEGDASVESSALVAGWCITRISATSLTPAQARDIAQRFGALPEVHTAVIIRIDNGDWMVDFTHSTANKAVAVAQYARLHGITPAQVIAAGDSYNDLPLLGACGLGIAMGNAVEELKALADYIAPSVDEDGLAVAIEEFVLLRL